MLFISNILIWLFFYSFCFFLYFLYFKSICSYVLEDDYKQLFKSLSDNFNILVIWVIVYWFYFPLQIVEIFFICQILLDCILYILNIMWYDFGFSKAIKQSTQFRTHQLSMGYGFRVSSVSNYCSVIQIFCICLPLWAMINSLFSPESPWHTVWDQVHANVACGWALKFLYDFMTSFSNCVYYSFWHPGSQNLLFLVPLYSVDVLLLILWMRNKWLLLELSAPI